MAASISRTVSGSVRRLRTGSLDKMPGLAATSEATSQAREIHLVSHSRRPSTSSLGGSSSSQQQQASLAGLAAAAPQVEMHEIRSVFGTDYDTVIRRIPTVLDPEQLPQIKTQMRSLTYLLPGCDVTSMVVQVPELLTLSLEEELLPRIMSLKTLLPGSKFTHSVQENPSILLRPALPTDTSLEA